MTLRLSRFYRVISACVKAVCFVQIKPKAEKVDAVPEGKYEEKKKALVKTIKEQRKLLSNAGRRGEAPLHRVDA